MEICPEDSRPGPVSTKGEDDSRRGAEAQRMRENDMGKMVIKKQVQTLEWALQRIARETIFPHVTSDGRSLVVWGMYPEGYTARSGTPCKSCARLNYTDA